MPIRIEYLLLIVGLSLIMITIFKNNQVTTPKQCQKCPNCPKTRCICPKTRCICPKAKCPTVPVECEKSPVDNTFTNLGLIVREDTNASKQYAQLFGKKVKENNDSWQYYARIQNNTGVQVPVLKNGKNCFSGGWPWCSLLYVGDKVSVSGETTDNWKVQELWPVSCTWQDDSLACQRHAL